MPRSVAPIISSPSGVRPLAYEIVSPLPPLRYSLGVMPSWPSAFSYTRLPEPKPAW